MPASKSRLSTCGAPLAYTLAGPPLRMMPAGRRLFSTLAGVSCRTISEKTLSCRMRRAMTCVYCDPKSRMMILLVMAAGGKRSG